MRDKKNSLKEGEHPVTQKDGGIILSPESRDAALAS
jgi:hypothetical protein